jgi:hypothetical protein
MATILGSRRARLALLACVAALVAAMAMALTSGSASAQCDPFGDVCNPPPPSDGGGGGGSGGSSVQQQSSSVRQSNNQGGGGDQSVVVSDGGVSPSFRASLFLPDISVPSGIAPSSPVFIRESPARGFNFAGPYRPGASTSISFYCREVTRITIYIDAFGRKIVVKRTFLDCS